MIEVVPMGRRILLAVLSLLLVLGGAIAILAGNGRSEVSSQLAAQHITFPANEAQGLLPGVKQFAGQKLTTGPQAKAYADGFIAVHVAKSTGGLTYSEVGAKLTAAKAAAKADPTNKDLAAKVDDLTAAKATALTGQLLRGTLLNAYGWYKFTTDLILAGVGIAIAAALLLALTIRVTRRTATV